MKKIYVTRMIPESGINLLKEKGYEVDISNKDGVLTKEELMSALGEKEYDAVLCLLTDSIDSDVFEATNAKIFANYAVGFNNIDLEVAKEKEITVTNTPGVLTNTVAEHTFALMMSISHRIVEADKFLRAGKYVGWEPELLLGTDMRGKTLGILGAGRIGRQVASQGNRGYDMKVVYYDIKRNEEIEKEFNAEFKETPEEVLKEADFVTVHVPLLDSTKHLINKEKVEMMKSSAYLINTSRGPVIDEAALVDALKNNVIKGAALDVFENEPELSPGMTELDNIIITPHIASGTLETRSAMSDLATQNIIDFLDGKTPQNVVK